MDKEMESKFLDALKDIPQQIYNFRGDFNRFNQNFNDAYHDLSAKLEKINEQLTEIHKDLNNVRPSI